MSCCDGWDADTASEVGICPECGGGVDEFEESTEPGCCWSPEVCVICHWKPCDGSC